MAGFLCLFFIFATPLCMRALSFLTRDGIPAPVVEGQSPTLWTGGQVLVAALVYSGWAGCADFGLLGACGAPLRCDAKASHHGVFSCGSPGSRCTDFSCCGTRLCSLACVIFSDQGLSLCLLCCWTDFYPLYHQGSSLIAVLICIFLRAK